MATRGVRDRTVVIGKGAHTPHCDPESLTRELYESLERLRTDHVEVYLLHRDNLDVPVGEFVDVLDEHHGSGRLHACGGSNWTARRVDEANVYARANGRIELRVVSNQLSLARMISPTFPGTVGAGDPAFRRWLQERDVALVAWSSQAAGFFTGLTPDGPLGHAWFDDDNLERRRRAEDLARQHGTEPVTIALAWVLHQGPKVFPIIGPRRLTELGTSLGAVDVELTTDELRWLDLG
jgi:aryl-alcohol dehydrogenase-like predicted oxidoreductase